MKKLMVLMVAGIVCMGLTACEGTEFDPSAISEVSRQVEEVTASVEEISEYVGEIQSSVQEGIDEANAVMEWYKTEAWANNPWISTPVTEEEVEGLIDAGQKEINAYIGENAVYDILSASDIEFFNEYFNDGRNNGFLLSTYECPEACDASQIFSRYSDAIEEVTDEDTEDDYAGKVPEEGVNATLLGNLGIENRELNTPLKFKKGSNGRYLFLDDVKDTVKLNCDGGFYYNNIFVIMMRAENQDTPFALTVLTKDDDGSVKIQMNYWSDDMEEVQWDGSFLYDLYDMMQDSDIQRVMNIPGFTGDVSLGAEIAADAMTGGKGLEEVAKLVSDAKDEAKTYVQEFEGYEVYYSNLDPSAVGEYVVSQIDVSSGNFKTAEGAGIGTTVEQLKEMYGDGVITRLAAGREQIMYTKGKYNMLFLIDKAGKVEEMTLYINEEFNK
ncbi:MAG: hypothetical protein K6E63_09680 [Lachnospiraceae bacterium]|nr:hypothetical protein [Lachnospiraceae bacterium]